MTSPLLTSGGSRAAGPLFALGHGWAWPAALVVLFVSLVYLPAHAATASSADALIATIAAIYVVAMSVALVHLVRGAVLRLSGNGDSIVLLGRGPEPVLDVRIRARWRFVAIGAGFLFAAVVAVGAALLGESADPTSNAHALSNLAFGANLALAAGVIVPAPGFIGWAFLLAVVDAVGTPPDERLRRAARLAQLLGLPVFLSLGVAAVLLNDPLLNLVGHLDTMIIVTRSRLAVGQDTIARFLRERVVGDVARPIANHAEADETVDAVVSRVADAPGVIAIEQGGALVGAIGPRQLAERAPGRSGRHIAELMVGLADLVVLPASTPAAGVLAAIARHGFALVCTPDGLASIESNDLLGQILASLAKPAQRADGSGSIGSGSLDER